MRLGIRELLFFTMLLALPVASYFFVFEPRNQEINAAQAEITNKQDKLRQLERATRIQNDLQAEIEKLGTAIQIFEEKLPTRDRFDVVLHEVTDLATRQKLTMSRVERQRVEVLNHFTEAPIRVSLRGDFDGFYRFLSDLERLSRIIHVKDMKIVRVRERNRDTDQMQADLRLSIFYETSGAGSTR